MADHLRLPRPRVLDSRRARTGGGEPVHRVPGRHGGKLKGELTAATSAPRPVRTKDGVNPAQVFKIRTVGGVDDAKLESSGFQWLGNTRDWTYFVLAEDGPVEFERMLDSYTAAGDKRAGAPDLTFFEHIEQILPYGPEDRRGPGLSEEALAAVDQLVLDAIIWPSPDAATARGRIEEVAAVLEQHRAEVLASDDRARYTVVRARVSPDCARDLLELAVIERLRTPPVPYLEPTTWRFATEEDLPEVTQLDGAPIGLIDDGVTDHPLLQGSIASRQSIPAGHTWREPSDHGTLVAGRLVYGDVEAALAGAEPWTALGPLHCVRVLEQDPDDPQTAVFPSAITHHLLVEQAIRKLHRDHAVRVFNLSIADRFSFSGPHLSLWSERMDELARELDVVIVVAAGNQSAEGLPGGEAVLDAYPDYMLEPSSRVAEPGAGANVLTVGSVAKLDAPQRIDGRARPGDRAVAAAGEPSPFSRSGPGAAGGIKPDLVHHGGNWVLNDAGILEDRDYGVSAISLVGGGERYFGIANGTSFAAPRVTRVAAQILGRYPAASANLVRALIGSATRPLALPDALEPKERRRLGGYGLLRDADALDSDHRRVALIYEGEIAPDTTEIHAVPVPDEFIEASGDRQIVLALAFDPPVRRTRREYLTAGMQVDLLRGVDADQIAEAWKRQPKSKEDRIALPKGRQRPDLEPGINECKGSTLQVRTYARRNRDTVDAEGIHVVVQHQSSTWYESEESQRYALVVVIEDREREGVDLRALAQARLPVAPRIEPRLRVRP